MIILGAGLAGCIAAHFFPRAHVLEAGKPENVGEHTALLRFRSDVLSNVTGIPFRKVRVTKSIYAYCRHHTTPTIDLINAYSRKVTGAIVERSIGDLASVDRWVAPEDFHARLVEELGKRISFEQRIARITPTALWREKDSLGFERSEGEPIISTIPLHAMIEACGLKDAYKDLPFVRAAITVQRWRVSNCDAYQTVYYPTRNEFGGIYRASLTGSILIVEGMSGEMPAGLTQHLQFQRVCDSFGIDPKECTLLSASQQRYGKIVSLPDATRQAILRRLTNEFGVYSFGRFSTWRNIILDDLVQDAAKIRRLMELSEYERSLT